jgi:hypothetical protein
LQRGPIFTEDIEISMERATGKYSVNTKSHKDGKEAVLQGTLELPPDVYNGLILSVVKDPPRGPARLSISWPSHPSPGSSSWQWHRPASNRFWSAISPRPRSTTC